MSQDTTLTPSATGPALALAQSHSTPHPLKLYGSWFCPFVQRVWIVLEEKAIPYQYIEINPYHKSPSFLALNPRGLVPTLAVPATGSQQLKPLYESTVLCEYLDEAFPDDGYGRLLPDDVYERARCRLWADHVSSRVVPGFYRLLQYNGDSEGRNKMRHEFLKSIKSLAREMSGDGGPWFMGERFGLVDVMLVPWARRLWLIDHYKVGGVGIPKKGEREEDEEVWARWETWYKAAEERKSVSDTWSEDAEYIKAYQRYADDTTQSEVGQATRQGRSLP
ncbi:hypothetical protein OQA88_4759 [Cercophora sp. LCS_1]